MRRIYGAAMRNNMNEKLEKIKNWFKRYPYMIALLYMAFYLTAFEWLEQNIVPKYIIHCKLDEMIPFCETFIIRMYSGFRMWQVPLSGLNAADGKITRSFA